MQELSRHVGAKRTKIPAPTLRTMPDNPAIVGTVTNWLVTNGTICISFKSALRLASAHETFIFLTTLYHSVFLKTTFST